MLIANDLDKRNYFRGFCTNQSLRMPVSAYTAVERGQSNTDQYKVNIEWGS